MPYHDTFYTFTNIIGYTGQLHCGPTVYFRCDATNRAGHITQSHHRPQNIGREYPFEMMNYRMENKVYAGQEVLHEYLGNYMFHRSRHKFIALGTEVRGSGPNRLDMNTLAILAQAIRQFPDAKPVPNLNNRVEAQLDVVVENKARMQHSLLAMQAAMNRLKHLGPRN